MEAYSAISEQIKKARKNKGLTQAELADLCHLDIRTIQRIESGTTSPRFYTIHILNEVLGTDFSTDMEDSRMEEKLAKYRKAFQIRKTTRLILAGMAMLVLLSAAILLLFPNLPKRIWAPFIYIFMFGILIGIGLTWRCPSCNAILGDVFNTRFCSKCGLRFTKQ